MSERINGSRVAIVGGSIAGCAAAIALTRAGCRVTVFERSKGELKDRGAGIVIPVPLRDELIEKGYIDPDYPAIPVTERFWIVRHPAEHNGRILWRQPSSGVANNWGILWRSVRAHVPDDAYREGVAVASVRAREDGATVVLGDGTEHEVELVVGADGYRSQVRVAMHPDSAPTYAGYVLWRGNYEETRIGPTDDRTPLEWMARAHMMIGFHGGHAVSYMIPGFDFSAAEGHRRVNWAIFSHVPERVRFDDPSSVPPGAVDPELIGYFHDLVDDAIPPRWAELVRLTTDDELSIQPIYDETVPSYVAGRQVLIGDAGTLSRPHTGSGATKALQDALALESACATHDTWDAALKEYDEVRTAAGNEIVELGRRIGRDQVENTPPWGAMQPEDLDAFTKGTLAGTPLYLYGNLGDEPEIEDG